MVSDAINKTIDEIQALVTEMKELGILRLKLPEIEIDLNPIYAKPTNNQPQPKPTLEEKLRQEALIKERRMYGNR
jgi:hypothetical protein